MHQTILASQYRFFCSREATDMHSTPLHLAVRETNDYDLPRILIGNGADIGSVNEEGQTPIHSWFNNGVSSLLRYHRDSIDPQLKDNRGMTVVHYASWTKRSNISDVKPFLLEHTALLTDRDRYGRTLLHLAAQRGNEVLVGMLLGHRDPSTKSTLDYYGQSPLHYAVESKRVQVIDMLRSHGVDADILDERGRTAILHAAAEGSLEAFEHLLILDGEQQLASLDKDGKDVFQLAYENDNGPIIQYLKNSHGMSADHSKESLFTEREDAQDAFLCSTALLVGICCTGGAVLAQIFTVLLRCYGTRAECKIWV